jgi:Kelch motif
MAGQWSTMPSICSSRRVTAYRVCNDWADKGSAHCRTWADQGSAECSSWADKGHQACNDWRDEGTSKCNAWADKGHNECCNWWPCSWFCDAFYWVANVICVGWYWVSSWVCHAWYWVANWVCQAWYWVAKWVCLAWFWVARWVCLAWQWIFHIFCMGDGGAAFLLTDGAILLNECSLETGTRRWWRLAPDSAGNYAGGIWNRVADSLQARKYFGSAVLADGRLLVTGGEYSDASGSMSNDWTNTGEIFDPQANSWTAIANAPVTPWGDVACSLLPNGTFFAGDLSSTQNFIYTPASNSWAAAGNKSARSNEESWLLTGEGTVLTVAIFNAPNAEKYVVATDTWVSAGALAASITEPASSEIGPGVVLPDGRAFFVGANGLTAVYTPGAIATAAGAWVAGPALPLSGKQLQGSKDGPGCLLTTGSVLFPIAPVDGVAGNFLSGLSFFEFDGTNINRVADPSNTNCPTYKGRLLLLPTGQVFWTREDHSDMGLYTVTGTFNNAWRPTITSAPGILVPGTSIDLTGTQFNGLSQAVGYGDDYTAATNYPLVRITHRKSQQVRYCRTSNHRIINGNSVVTSMGVATGATPITTTVDLPGDLALGECTLEVVANGIPSEARAVVVQTRPG